eukprot:g4429.t1
MSSLRTLRRGKSLYRSFLSYLAADWTGVQSRSSPCTAASLEWHSSPRWLSIANKDKSQKRENPKQSLMIEDEEASSITDQIPAKPMTAVEGISYTAIILAAFAVLGGCLYAFISAYVWNPVEYTCFNITLERVRQDPRVTVRVGDSIKGYGSESMSRRQRHMIRNRSYKDSNGVEHLQIQFNIRGSDGVGVVYADMFRDEFKKWQYTYLYVDVPERGRNSLQRLALVTPPTL